MGRPFQPAQMQGSGVGGASGDGLDHPHNTLSMDPELLRTRELIRGRIIDLLRQRHQQPINDALLTKLRDIARRLEEALYKGARTKEDYMNLDTLDQRLYMVVRRFQQQRQNVSSGISMTAANSSMDPELLRTRELIRGRITDLLRQRHQQPINDALLTKLREIARRLEEALYEAARTEEEYMNLDTLDQRLHMIVRRFQQQRQNVN